MSPRFERNFSTMWMIELFQVDVGDTPTTSKFHIGHVLWFKQIKYRQQTKARIPYCDRQSKRIEVLVAGQILGESWELLPQDYAESVCILEISSARMNYIIKEKWGEKSSAVSWDGVWWRAYIKERRRPHDIGLLKIETSEKFAKYYNEVSHLFLFCLYTQ